MKILHLSPYSPVPADFGGALRIYYLLRGLAEEHDVTFVTFGTEKERKLLVKEFGEIVRQIHVIPHSPLPDRYPILAMLWAFLKRQGYNALYTKNKLMQEKLNNLFETENYDLVLFEFPFLGIFNMPDNIIQVMDEHNVEYQNLRRMYEVTRRPHLKLFYYRESKKTFEHEIKTGKKVDAILVTSQHDKMIFKEHIKDNPIYVVPNGVDTNYFLPSDSQPEPYSMVFTGTMDYLPNYDAMIYFLDKIFPMVKKEIPRAKIYIVGNKPPEILKCRSSNDVIVTGFVDDVRPDVWKANVYVVPLRMGSGTRLKILEGLAMKKAIVTTSIGCEGIDVSDNKDVIIADKPEVFAQKVIDLMHDKKKIEELGNNGYEMVTTKYDWENVSAAMNDVLFSIYNSKKSISKRLNNNDLINTNGKETHNKISSIKQKGEKW